MVPNLEKPNFSKSEWNFYADALHEYFESIYETLKTQQTEDTLIYEMIEYSVLAVVNALFLNHEIDESKLAYK